MNSIIAFAHFLENQQKTLQSSLQLVEIFVRFHMPNAFYILSIKWKYVNQLMHLKNSARLLSSDSIHFHSIPSKTTFLPRKYMAILKCSSTFHMKQTKNISFRVHTVFSCIKKPTTSSQQYFCFQISFFVVWLGKYVGAFLLLCCIVTIKIQIESNEN